MCGEEVEGLWLKTVYLNFSICNTAVFRVGSGKSKVYLAVVNAKQQPGLVLRLLIAFGLINLAGGNSQLAKGNEAGGKEKLHSWCLSGSNPTGTLSSSHTLKYPMMREPGQGPASSENQHRLPCIPSTLLGSTCLGRGSNLAPSTESSCHFFHVLD